MINIILCGGSGTRLWPLSRELFPKQFIKLFNGQSLFQETLQRNKGICEQFIIVSNKEQHFLALDQLEKLQVGSTRFILESAARNTAPAIALACLAVDPDEIVLVTPSDHLITETEEYKESVKQAEGLARDGYLVTFGIKPTHAETGYGYIQSDGYDVISFKEKPDLETAKQYISDGRFFWNSGMFVFRAGTFLRELETVAVNVYEATSNAFQSSDGMDPILIGRREMESIPSISVDYAVMEKSKKVKVIPSQFGWSDLGSFDAVYNEFDKDEHGNTLNENYINVDSGKNLIISDRTVATVDIEDLIIVDTDDALLITKKGSSMKVKEVVNQLNEINSSLTNVHVTTYRPWGSYTLLEESGGYKIRRTIVKPGCKLTMQKHYHRNEHWIVLSGTAKVTLGDREVIIRPNESTYIPISELHRLENPGKIDLVLIEVQTGEYLSEDDIVRVGDLRDK
ncbi:mannose-1-phosphate guanylyltransferase/mannose-6-phosphate isomerase [Paenibacillus contaminans]|uniref:mannose-1-phosphate guanylyltransferase n=1 Tax=Paenibacillus contaminans TaxID=450362 RepID=A0A329M2G5_9BACL|nr:mannose-1-phosphate guanylyltransferase/mannose-6-phosphate isomerase [Paenibacillus contaminans]RAV13792.1 mannose-1-phosphate guanylyltransferase/mannose-6-phosphate isomerase [Paenibacillus contaminans]